MKNQTMSADEALKEIFTAKFHTVKDVNTGSDRTEARFFAFISDERPVIRVYKPTRDGFELCHLWVVETYDFEAGVSLFLKEVEDYITRRF